MKKRCTRVLSLEIKKLKGITNLGEINLDHNITGIFGPNGVGKSTILQALAAAFQPPRNASPRSDFASWAFGPSRSTRNRNG